MIESQMDYTGTWTFYEGNRGGILNWNDFSHFDINTSIKLYVVHTYISVYRTLGSLRLTDITV